MCSEHQGRPLVIMGGLCCPFFSQFFFFSMYSVFPRPCNNSSKADVDNDQSDSLAVGHAPCNCNCIDVCATYP